jgi:hypothetical protein
MVATVLTQTLSANTAITFDVSSLAPSGSFLTGRESNQVDNTATNYLDAIVNVKGITGHASTAPSIGQQINLYVWGADTSLATTGIDTLDGTDSNESITHAGILNSLKTVPPATVTATTVGLVHYFMPFSVAQLFGGTMPKFWGLYLAHNHTGALAASQANLFSFNGVTFTQT